MHRFINYATAAAIAVISLHDLNADDWNQWRGPDRQGRTAEDSGMTRGAWPPEDAVWQVETGVGGSAPVVADGRLYTLGWQDDKDVVRCFDAESGIRLWEKSYDCPLYGRRSEGDKGLYSGPSASPVFDPKTGYLMTLSTDGHLNCWNTKKAGERVWAVSLYDRFDIPQRPLVGSRKLRDYGYTSSPLIHKDQVIVEVGDDTGNLIAFSVQTGRQIWTSQSKDEAGHTGGPVPITIDGIPCVAVLTLRNLVVVRLDRGNEGRTLAQYPWVTDFANSIATPVVLGSSIIITSEYNQYSICRLDITASGITEVWRQPYASGVCSPVIQNGFVYWCWRGLYCLDFETGNPIWRGGRFGDTASLLGTADDRLIAWADRGELALVESANRSPNRYTEIARKTAGFTSDVWPHVVLANGRLYCRDRDGHLKCFRL